MSKPRHIVILIADSLRYDSVFGPGGAHLPFASAHGTTFTQARSAGCWTLPGTASLFTGRMPHEHGADTWSRGLDPEVPTLAARLQAQGYQTHQITANVATTEIFGLERGFDSMNRMWQTVTPRHRKLHQVLVLGGKPRLRKKILTTDFVTGRLSEDLAASMVWLQSTAGDVFDQARARIAEAEAQNKGTFLFLNLMESHFPYHIADTFETLSDGWFAALREIHALYHLVNQTWLTTGEQPIDPPSMELLRERQRRAWLRLAPVIDQFVEELVTRHDSLVYFGADHGDNFGEQGWAYHFSNVTDAGNRVPLFRIAPGEPAKVEHTPLSSRGVYHDVLAATGAPDGVRLSENPACASPVMQSCWYNNQGRTLGRYRHNQICFVQGNRRFLHRAGQWHEAPITTDGPEALFQHLPAGTNPLQELSAPPAERAQLQRIFDDFQAYAARVTTNPHG